MYGSARDTPGGVFVPDGPFAPFVGVLYNPPPSLLRYAPLIGYS
jgi:hypothetical protein